MIAKEMGITIRINNLDLELEIEKELQFIQDNDLFPASPKTNEKNLGTKIPCIAIMGHVDHGKTTLLDHLRSSFVADGEAGGITQHIAAFSVNVLGEKMTFLDTPGHAAFAAIRERGASVVDRVIVVVAADDGVMPQTIQSVNFAKKSNTPITFVITKTDRKGADLDRVTAQIRNYFDSENVFPISAKTGEGVEEMLLFLQESIEEQNLKAAKAGDAEGFILETQAPKTGLGLLSTILVKRGELKSGQHVIAGTHVAKIRQLFDEKMKKIKKLGPGEFGLVVGFKSRPDPGAYFQATKKSLAEKAKKFRELEARKQFEMQYNIDNDSSENLEFDKEIMRRKVEKGYYRLSTVQRAHLDLMIQAKKLEALEIQKEKSFQFLVKGDVSGSVEAIIGRLKDLF
jgi:translation initiation factor IF-2